MKQLLEKWSGKFEVDGEIYNDLYNLKLHDGDNFHVRLLSKRREIGDGKTEKASLSRRRL